MIISNEENKRIMNTACKSWMVSFLSANEETIKRYGIFLYICNDVNHFVHEFSSHNTNNVDAYFSLINFH